MEMKKIRIRCWFSDSEYFLAKLVIANGIEISIRKIIDPYETFTSGNRDIGGQYEISGNETDIKKLISLFESYNSDVEIFE
jgi:hypothetical protein